MRGLALAALLLVMACTGPTPSSRPSSTPPAAPTTLDCNGQPIVLPTPPFAPPSLGCATAPPPASGPDTSPATVEVLELPGPGTELAPGRYARTSFEPYITFEVADGWTAEQQVNGFFDIQDEPGSLDVVAVQWANLVGAETAEEAVTQILEKPDLQVSEATPVAIDGVTGLRVVVETTDPADTNPPVFHPVLTVPPGPLSIASGRRLEATLLDMDGSVLAVLVGGSIAEWDRAIQITRPVLTSMTIAY